MIPRTRPALSLAEFWSILRLRGTRSDFEAAVAAKAGTRYGLAFAYGHAGFYALLRALNLTQAEVILTAYTCSIMPEVIVATGNVPVFVDIDPADYNMEMRALKSAITNKTRVIVATHMFGYRTDVDAVRQIAHDERIVILEDAAMTFPGSGGLRGDVGLFSFGPGKPLFTMRGGVVVTGDAGLYDKLKAYRDREMGHLPTGELARRWALLMIHYLLSNGLIYGLTRRLRLSKDTISGLASRVRPVQNDEQFSTSSLPGDYATRYADFQARMGLAQLRKADRILARRRVLAELYGEALRDIPGLTPAPLKDGASYALYTVRVQDRDAIGFCQRMQARGIETSRMFRNALPNLIKYSPYARGIYPMAEQAGREVVNLPAYAGLTEGRVRYVADSARQVLQANRQPQVTVILSAAKNPGGDLQ
jgi:dTDP-4-amino-4,6-dideoxygalactose transaminase